jgi:hypothetical protein
MAVGFDLLLAICLGYKDRKAKVGKWGAEVQTSSKSSCLSNPVAWCLIKVGVSPIVGGKAGEAHPSPDLRVA